MPCACPDLLQNSGNPVYGIPVSSGISPLSTLTQRYVGVGSIPNVLNYANWTSVDGQFVAGIPSNGGILNPLGFFRNRTGSVYNNPNAQLAELCCDT